MRVNTLVLAILAVVLALGWPAAGHAQTSDPAKLTESLKPLIEQAKKDGSTVLVISPGTEGDGSGEGVARPTLTDILQRTKFRLRLVLKGSEQFFESVGQTMAKQSPQGRGWLPKAILWAIVAIFLGRLAAKPVAIWLAKVFVPRLRDVPHTRSYLLSIQLFRIVTFMFVAAVAAVVTFVLINSYLDNDRATFITALFVASGYYAHRMIRSLTYNFLAPSVPAYRPIRLEDDVAKRIYRSLQGALIVSIVIICVCLWMEKLGLDENTHKLALLFGTGVVATLLSGVAVLYRHEIADVIRAGAADSQIGWLQNVLARSWHMLVVIYMLCAWMVSSVRVLLDLPNGPVLVAKPLAILVVGMFAYAMLLIFIDRVLGETWIDEDAKAEEDARLEGIAVEQERIAEEHARREEEARQAAVLQRAHSEDALDEELGDEEDILPDTSKPERDTSVPLSTYKPLAEHAAGILVFVSSITAIAAVWGVDVQSEQSLFGRFNAILLISFMAYVAYRVVNVWVAAKRAAEGDYDSAFPDEEMMGGGASRFLTLLPMFRNFLLITIVVISGMIVLSELGVDIAPLFAGAGVVGLAIGFGAQTLIRDVFSGAFFLIDDAFRKGEYIDIGEAKGTVEKISIRSFQLRHHRGALNTIPFGEIKQITNYSRDWVMMKLPIRVTYDTDLEKLRKLVKRLGIELLEDEDIGAKFLQPLKSQGALEMGDSAIIIRVKFMTRPGDQFSVRTKVLTKIRELFAEHGIKFAHREVTVRVAQAEDMADMSDAAAGAAAAAATAAGEDQQPGQKPAADKM